MPATLAAAYSAGVPTAVVTGASSGLGLAFANRLAATGYDVVLVARDEQRLRDLAADLVHRFGCVAEVLPADLTDRAQLTRVAERLVDRARPVDLLVNNAGNALRKPFLANDVADEESMLDLHVRATLVLTHAALGPMTQRRAGGVINVSSVAAWAPLGTYSAHKAWVTAFSQAVAGQVASRGVRVTALAPGYVRTEFHQRAGITMDGKPALVWLDADDVVEQALAAWRKGRVVVVPSAKYKAVAGLLRNAPHETIHRLRTRGRR
jgi:short-subunit dehydrogenase